MKKPSRVVFISNALEKEYNTLRDDDFLKKAIGRAIRELQRNTFCGTQIPKRLFPKEYVSTYKISNLWKYDLPKGWRLLYTVTALNEVELISAILQWFDHKQYEKKFKY